MEAEDGGQFQAEKDWPEVGHSNQSRREEPTPEIAANSSPPGSARVRVEGQTVSPLGLV